MIDSTGKLPDGTLVGHHRMMGNMDECISIEVSKPRFEGELLENFR